MSVDLREFLTARLDEDEAAACAATKGPWTSDLRNGDGDQFGEIWRLPPLDDEYEPDEATAAHIARWDPARVLAEVAANRRIVDLHARGHECSGYDHQSEIDPCRYYHDFETCSTLRLLAAPYAEHPDYDPAWRIDA